MFNIQEELKKLPGKPGVYIMHDDTDAIIYVGKAVNLKNRVRQYFQTSRNKGIKIEQMVSKIQRFEYIITDSELEALVLECNLIKEHRPKYNTMLKDDKTYPYIKVTIGEEFPRILFSRQMKKDKSKYYGPYTSAGAVKDSIELIRKIYKIRTCNRNLPKDIAKDRACLNYHIHQCEAPCQGYISSEEYKKSIAKAMDFLNGNHKNILKELEEKMLKASNDMEFEKAIEYRELMNSVQQISQKQKITSSDREDKDVIALAISDDDAVVQVFFIRGGRLIGREHFYLTVGPEDKKSGILGSFIKQFYSGTPYIPKQLMIQEEIEDSSVIEEWLSKKKEQKVHIKVPQKGMKEKLVELAAQNAQLVLNQDKERLKREEGRTIGAVKEIANLLDLEHLERMEAFDISNTSGFQSVGSMVVYEKGKPYRNDYRKFKIKSVQGPDDYSSMAEVLTRRFKRGLEEKTVLEQKKLEESLGKFNKFPDLIMMDGGKGQVNIALKVLSELGLSIPVCGMVKDDNHRTRGLLYNDQEIFIDKNSEAFKLITRIQDEAHRYAIEYHRSLRSKNQIHSILDDIKGVGPSRRKALMRAFQSIEKIKEASIDELAEVETMNQRSAKQVFEFFHKK
ncbi:excinuclease ABC subunit UvrC [Anaerosacchariphilus polymeriproducens]|uniref:UvrABC system protein C n=1 Tax=Anaerosacchariphilus polymeriproducens TaxID=1812858 RepID=A0A371AR97_9FIRM|nr:excinuclease ABC subunit UvrC [Anaerosacchariphilus polymeriproducens]RDU22062.1 excinuclease ABC subunit UvrC [Anaerosacchariphilus polymeriproducens]